MCQEGKAEGTGSLSCATKACGCVSIHMLCLTKDGGRPSEVTIQVGASNHRKLLWSKAMVVSVTEKAKPDFVRYVSMETNKIEPL